MAESGENLSLIICGLSAMQRTGCERGAARRTRLVRRCESWPGVRRLVGDQVGDLAKRIRVTDDYSLAERFGIYRFTVSAT